jgi:hypothetical protein
MLVAMWQWQSGNGTGWRFGAGDAGDDRGWDFAIAADEYVTRRGLRASAIRSPRAAATIVEADGLRAATPRISRAGLSRVCRRCPGRRQSGRSLVLGLWLAMWDALQRLEGGGRGHVALTSFNNAEGRTAAQMGLRIALPCHCHFATPCHFATRSAFS